MGVCHSRNSQSKNTIETILKKCQFITKNYLVERKLGEGGFGSVYEATAIYDRKPCAIKILNPKIDNFNDKIKEIFISTNLAHAHIITSLNVYCNASMNHGIIVMEKASTSLDKVIKNSPTGLPIKYLLQILADTLSGLQYAHDTQKISHSDIKPSNVLVFIDMERHDGAQKIIVENPQHTFKLADWGSGKLAGKSIDKTTTLEGEMDFTKAFAAPQILQLQEINWKINLAKADIYSLGLLLLNCCGISSSKFRNLNEKKNKIEHQSKLEKLITNSSIEEKYGIKLTNILKSMIKYDSEERLAIPVIISKLQMIVDELDGKGLTEEENKIKIKKEAEVLYNLACQYREGTGKFKKNLETKVEFLQKASEMGYDKGTGIGKDEKKAVEWYQKAIEFESASAMTNLGVCYKNGTGVEQNSKKAVELFKKSSKLEYALAMNNLGVCYYEANGVEKNFKKALKFFTKSANLEDPYGMLGLGICLLNGEGCDEDPIKAYENFKKAADLGLEEAKNQIKRWKFV